MYVVLKSTEQGQPDAYPAWCSTSWFHDFRDITSDVESHYHDAAEIWLWHEGGADGVVDGEKVSLVPGVMVYTPAKCLHDYRAHGRHSNTGIGPRPESWMRSGHLHVEKTGENLSPEMAAYHCETPAGSGRWHDAIRGWTNRRVHEWCARCRRPEPLFRAGGQRRKGVLRELRWPRGIPAQRRARAFSGSPLDRARRPHQAAVPRSEPVSG